MVARRRRTKGPLKPRTASTLKRYKLTVDEWQQILDAQGGKCFICGKGGVVKHLSIDHDHAIERELGEVWVRGLLCARCNSGLGRFEWSNEVLERLVAYVETILAKRHQLGVR